LIDPGNVDLLMRLLPSHGWTAGLFGRRDRALLTLAAQTTIPYRQLSRLTVAQLGIADGVATITDHHGIKHFVEAAADPGAVRAVRASLALSRGYLTGCFKVGERCPYLG